MSRILKLTSPLMGGAIHLQRDVNRRLSRWHVNWQVGEDGRYGPETKQAAEAVLYGLGVRSVLYAQGITPELQGKVRDFRKLNHWEKQRFHAREGWRKRLAKRRDGHGAALAIAYARKMASLHIVEHPAGSNRGPYIDNWNRLVGTPPGPYAYWCGAFANGCLMAAGFHPQHFMAYCPNIVNMAQSGSNGWSWHSVADSKPGDLPLYREGSVAGHVEILVDKPFTTVGGNTSSDAGSGSQSNGGGVFLRHRNPSSSGFPVMGCARPPYAKPY